VDKWDERFIELAKHISTWSKDPSTQVGAVITKGKSWVFAGYNGLPEGVPDEDWILNNRIHKYPRIIHAEANAIVRARHDLSGCTIFTYPFAPCSNCAGLIIQAGIIRVVAPKLPQELEIRWGENLEISKDLFKRAGVKFEEV
jgi:dCMP deaminase